MAPAKLFQDYVFWIYNFPDVTWVVAIWVVVINLLHIAILIGTLRLRTLAALRSMLLFIFAIHIMINQSYLVHLFDYTLLFHITRVFHWTYISLEEFLDLGLQLILFFFVRFFLFFFLFVFQSLCWYFLIKDLDFRFFLPLLFFSYFLINNFHE